MAYFKITHPIYELMLKAKSEGFLGCEKNCDIQIISYEDMETLASNLKRMYPTQHTTLTIHDLIKYTGLISRGKHVCNSNLKNAKITLSEIHAQSLPHPVVDNPEADSKEESDKWRKYYDNLKLRGEERRYQDMTKEYSSIHIIRSQEIL
jgi:hypothetical protein